MANAITPAPFQTGFRLIDGNDLNANFANPIRSSQTGITATAGGGQTNAFPLTAAISRVSFVVTAGDSVILPPAKVGAQMFVENAGANAMQVFATGTDTINGIAGSTGVSQAAGAFATYSCTAAGFWRVAVNAIDIKRTTAAVTANASTTYANVTGLSFTVVPGTYRFRLVLPSTVASGTGGIKYAFNYTTAVLSSIEATGLGYTASAVAVQHTTTATAQADLFTQAAVVIMTVVEGTMVVTTGGTVDVQMAQNTSNASNTVALIGGSAEFDRIA